MIFLFEIKNVYTMYVPSKYLKERKIIYCILISLLKRLFTLNDICYQMSCNIVLLSVIGSHTLVFTVRPITTPVGMGVPLGMSVDSAIVFRILGFACYKKGTSI